MLALVPSDVSPKMRQPLTKEVICFDGVKGPDGLPQTQMAERAEWPPGGYSPHAKTSVMVRMSSGTIGP